jgi:leucyl-tRNA---protein transferase
MKRGPIELVVHDELEPCPYLPDRVARKPLRMPVRPLKPSEFEEKLQIGDRRFGRFLYGTKCPDCSACEPIRLDVSTFLPSRTQRRVLRRGAGLFQTELGPLTLSDERIRLYNLHEQGRGLARGDSQLSDDSYRMFLVDTCCDGFEIRYSYQGELFGVAIVDKALRSLSAVYTYYNPSFEKYSPGVYSIMTQLELCKQWGLRYLYLGFYIKECKAMAYKARYWPHQRRINGRWMHFESEQPGIEIPDGQDGPET